MLSIPSAQLRDGFSTGAAFGGETIQAVGANSATGDVISHTLHEQPGASPLPSFSLILLILLFSLLVRLFPIASVYWEV